ncbi:MAG: DUF4249 domain-containing protein [Cytophagales bacterium]|nr:DUF4249 domain-containing protein [Cytophagales bacterium]
MFLFFALNACQEALVDIDVDDSTPRLVVGGLFAPEEEMVIKLTRSVSIAESTRFSDFDVKDANVRIYEGGTIVDELRFREQRDDSDRPVNDWGAYYATAGFVPESGKTYTLVVEAPGFEPVRATTTIPGAVDIVTFDVEEVAFQTREAPMVVAANLSFADDPSQKNYYAVEVLGTALIGQWYDDNDELVTVYDSASVNIKATLPDKIDFDAEVSPFKDNILYLSDDAFNGELYALDLSLGLVTDLERYSSFKAQLKHITEEHYLYATTGQLQEQETAENPFSQPVQVFGNIENGLGIFAGFGKSRLEYIPFED